MRRSAHPVPGVEEADDLVAVDPLALAHDGPDHGIQPRAVAAAGEDADSHRVERRGRGGGVLSIGGVGWDASRPVPWRRLLKEWVIYAAIMTAVFAVFFRDRQPAAPSSPACSSAGRCTSGLGFVLAKFGYQRKTLAELRTPRAAPPSGAADERRSAVRAAPPRADAPHLERSEPAVEGPAPVTCVIAIDAGTTGIRSRAVFTDGSPSVASYREFTQHFPQPGWVEHDPTEIWDAVRATLHDVVEQVGASLRGGDRDHQPARDRRGVGSRHREAATGGPSSGRIGVPPPAATSSPRPGPWISSAERTGLVLDPYFSGTKFEWLLGPGGVPGHRATWRSARSTPG